jgi:two-component system sensor histidine kinase YesM
MIVRIRELINDINHREKEKRKSDLRVLQSQINPHFLHNTLNTIKFLAVLQGADNIKSVSESLSTLLHINMDERNLISVEEELEYIRSYLNIQKFKYSNKFNASFHIEEEIKTCMVLKLLLQPIIENALEYGIGPLPTQGDILIKIYKDGQALKLRVQDNGPGMDQELIAKLLDNSIQTKGIGIRNTISRIKLNFGDDFGIFILSEPYLYTIVEISVPLIIGEEVENHV